MLGFLVCYGVSLGKLSTLTSGYPRLFSFRICVNLRTTLLICLLYNNLLSHFSYGFICHTMAGHLGMRVGSVSDLQVCTQPVAPYRFITVLSPPIKMFHRCTGMPISCTNSFPSYLCGCNRPRSRTVVPFLSPHQHDHRLPMETSSQWLQLFLGTSFRIRCAAGS